MDVKLDSRARVLIIGQRASGKTKLVNRILKENGFVEQVDMYATRITNERVEVVDGLLPDDEVDWDADRPIVCTVQYHRQAPLGQFTRIGVMGAGNWLPDVFVVPNALKERLAAQRAGDVTWFAPTYDARFAELQK